MTCTEARSPLDPRTIAAEAALVVHLLECYECHAWAQTMLARLPPDERAQSILNGAAIARRVKNDPETRPMVERALGRTSPQENACQPPRRFVE